MYVIVQTHIRSENSSAFSAMKCFAKRIICCCCTLCNIHFNCTDFYFRFIKLANRASPINFNWLL